jgi:hypothetical protein
MVTWVRKFYNKGVSLTLGFISTGDCISFKMEIKQGILNLKSLARAVTCRKLIEFVEVRLLAEMKGIRSCLITVTTAILD